MAGAEVVDFQPVLTGARNGRLTMRLGDDIDDYCSRCKRATDHAVVTLEGDEVKKVRCRTCQYEHNYRKNRTGKKQMTAQDAFNKLLSQAMGTDLLPDSKKSKK